MKYIVSMLLMLFMLSAQAGTTENSASSTDGSMVLYGSATAAAPSTYYASCKKTTDRSGIVGFEDIASLSVTTRIDSSGSNGLYFSVKNNLSATTYSAINSFAPGTYWSPSLVSPAISATSNTFKIVVNSVDSIPTNYSLHMRCNSTSFNGTVPFTVNW